MTYRQILERPGDVRYDPRTEACLTALTIADQPRFTEVGLIEALERADDLAGIAGATAGETVAVVEYLLALLYASEHVPRTPSQWREWVETGEPLNKAADWLRGRPDDEWNLFDPVQPLGQNAQLAPFLDARGVGTAQIVIERAGDYNQFFDHVHLFHPEPMPAAAAFRALLSQMAYGLGGNAKLTPNLLGKGLFSQSVARLGGRVRVLALGRTLGDTLRLNLAPTARRDLGTFNRSWTDGRSRRSFRGPKTARRPDGPADVHSYLCRSILMRPVVAPDGTLAVDRVLMGSGEILPPLHARHQQDAVLEDTRNGPTPLKARPDRALWREAHALYAAVAERSQGEDLYGRLAGLPKRHIDLWAVGLIARQSTPVAWVADEFPYVVGQEEQLRRAAEGGSEICEYVAKALWLAADVARQVVYRNPKPSDIPAQRDRFNGAAGMWAGAGDPFHELLESIAHGLAPEEGLGTFGVAIAALARTSLEARLNSLPDRGPGILARLKARERLRRSLSADAAPHALKGVPHHVHPA